MDQNSIAAVTWQGRAQWSYGVRNASCSGSIDLAQIQNRTKRRVWISSSNICWRSEEHSCTVALEKGTENGPLILPAWDRAPGLCLWAWSTHSPSCRWCHTESHPGSWWSCLCSPTSGWWNRRTYLPRRALNSEAERNTFIPCVWNALTFLIQVLPTFPHAVRVCGKGVVNWPNNLIHSLHVGDPGVEFGVDEEDPLHHLPVCFTPTGQHLIFVGWIQVQCFSRWADLGEHIQLTRGWCYCGANTV